MPTQQIHVCSVLQIVPQVHRTIVGNHNGKGRASHDAADRVGVPVGQKQEVAGLKLQPFAGGRTDDATSAKNQVKRNPPSAGPVMVDMEAAPELAPDIQYGPEPGEFDNAA